jgi:hypothetical protein
MTRQMDDGNVRVQHEIALEGDLDLDPLDVPGLALVNDDPCLEELLEGGDRPDVVLVSDEDVSDTAPPLEGPDHVQLISRYVDEDVAPGMEDQIALGMIRRIVVCGNPQDVRSAMDST